jgi:hypothetical protein
MTLTTAVTNILSKKVTDDQAKQFALDNYGILATYIRQQFVSSLKSGENKIKTKKK